MHSRPRGNVIALENQAQAGTEKKTMKLMDLTTYLSNQFNETMGEIVPVKKIREIKREHTNRKLRGASKFVTTTTKLSEKCRRGGSQLSNPPVGISIEQLKSHANLPNLTNRNHTDI
jgi:hypothetical protein